MAPCYWIADDGNDGDSFLVATPVGERVFRLYFVDACETNARFPSRVAEQAAYFQIPPANVPTLGQAAARFVEAQLSEPFAVWTRWQDALGSGQRPRFFAFIETRDGRDLITELVRHGYARIYGVGAPHPNGVPARNRQRQLRRLEKKARAAQRGGWQPRFEKMERETGIEPATFSLGS